MRRNIETIKLDDKNKEVKAVVVVHNFEGSKKKTTEEFNVTSPLGLFSNENSEAVCVYDDNEPICSQYNTHEVYYQFLNKHKKYGTYRALANDESKVMLIDEKGINLETSKKFNMSNTQETLKNLIIQPNQALIDLCTALQSAQIILTTGGTGSFAPSTFQSIIDAANSNIASVDKLFY